MARKRRQRKHQQQMVSYAGHQCQHTHLGACPMCKRTEIPIGIVYRRWESATKGLQRKRAAFRAVLKRVGWITYREVA
jgi:4-hydroxy-3-methylbut-2-en-1-yl diphosphate synthase IspG/GcpE